MTDTELLVPLAPLACLGGLYSLEPKHGLAVQAAEALLAVLYNAHSNVYDLEDAISAVELAVGGVQRRLELADDPALLHGHALHRYFSLDS